MSVGRAVRTRLGRFEVPVSDRYRGWFVDLDALVTTLVETITARRILEIGCGDGQLAGRLLDRFAAAVYQGIDVAPDPGRLFRGDPDRAQFRTIDSSSYRAELPATFDLVLLVDVLHHVPDDGRGPLLDDVRGLTAPGGHYVVKDWTRSRTPAHLAAWASDTLLTGDRVAFLTQVELERLVVSQSAGDRKVLTTFVPPRANNAMFVRERM